jgi:hypothetical protein
MPRRKNSGSDIPKPMNEVPSLPTNAIIPTPASITAQVAKLPDVCQHKIYKYLHKMYMEDLCREIIHNVVWVRLRSGNNYRYEFLTSSKKNYTVWDNNKLE